MVDDDGGVVGIVSADDLLESMAEDLAKLARALRRNVERETSERGVFTGAARPRVTYPSFGTVASQ